MEGTHVRLLHFGVTSVKLRGLTKANLGYGSCRGPGAAARSAAVPETATLAWNELDWLTREGSK